VTPELLTKIGLAVISIIFVGLQLNVSAVFCGQVNGATTVLHAHAPL
jgi:ABC-type multidrug transport system permease subunit